MIRLGISVVAVGSRLAVCWMLRYLGDHPGNMVQTQTVEDLEREVQGSDKLVVVEFFVPACPGCRKLFPKIKQIAANNSDVKFVQVGPSWFDAFYVLWVLSCLLCLSGTDSVVPIYIIWLSGPHMKRTTALVYGPHVGKV